ncbi:MAG: ExbD/TolR family protein [Deltaproteobacteria bacterium]
MIQHKRIRRKVEAEINITPFTDVILVLLIIFMIATPLISQGSINVKVDLPEAQSAKSSADKGPAFVTITDEGIVYLNDEVVTREELKKRIGQRYRDNPDVSVVIRSEKLVRFQDVVSVLDVLNAIGVRNLDIAAAQRQG